MSWQLAWIKMSSRPTWVMQGKSVKKTEDRREGERDGGGDRNREKRKTEREEGGGKGRETDLSKA